MSAVLRLTDREARRALERLFEESRGNFRYVLEAIGETMDWHKAYVNRDGAELIKEFDKALHRYLEATGDYETELSKAQGRKELE